MTPNEHALLVQAAKETQKPNALYEHRFHPLTHNNPNEISEVSPISQEVTKAVGSAIFDPTHPKFAKLSLDSYNELCYKLKRYGSGNVMVVLAGSSAVALLIPGHDLFSFSDIDLKVLINPRLPPAEFKELQARVCEVCNQVVATHKRRLDRLLFKKKEGDGETNYFLTAEEERLFRASMLEKIERLKMNVKSPIQDVETRNRLSSKSFLITCSNVLPNTSVKCEVSILPKAECIPLPATPIRMSVNDTIDVVHEDGRTTSFTLYRLRMHHMMTQENGRIGVNMRCTKDDRVHLQLFKRYEKVNADLVDLTIPNQNDTELISFERRGGFAGYLTQCVNAFGFLLRVPTLQECKLEHEKMLHVFTCPESKRSKRELKLKALEEALCLIPITPPKKMSRKKLKRSVVV